MMLNVEGGSVYTALTASKAMFDMVRVLVENVAWFKYGDYGA